MQVVAGVKKIETKTIDSSMEKIGEDGQVYIHIPPYISTCINYGLYFRKEK